MLWFCETVRIAPLPVVYKPCVHKGLAVIYPGNVAEYSVGGAGIEVHISAVSDIYILRFALRTHVYQEQGVLRQDEFLYFDIFEKEGLVHKLTGI